MAATKFTSCGWLNSYTRIGFLFFVAGIVYVQVDMPIPMVEVRLRKSAALKARLRASQTSQDSESSPSFDPNANPTMDSYTSSDGLKALTSEQLLKTTASDPPAAIPDYPPTDSSLSRAYVSAATGEPVPGLRHGNQSTALDLSTATALNISLTGSSVSPVDVAAGLGSPDDISLQKEDTVSAVDVAAGLGSPNNISLQKEDTVSATDVAAGLGSPDSIPVQKEDTVSATDVAAGLGSPDSILVQKEDTVSAPEQEASSLTDLIPRASPLPASASPNVPPPYLASPILPAEVAVSLDGSEGNPPTFPVVALPTTSRADSSVSPADVVSDPVIPITPDLSTVGANSASLTDRPADLAVPPSTEGANPATANSAEAARLAEPQGSLPPSAEPSQSPEEPTPTAPSTDSAMGGPKDAVVIPGSSAAPAMHSVEQIPRGGVPTSVCGGMPCSNGTCNPEQQRCDLGWVGSAEEAKALGCPGGKRAAGHLTTCEVLPPPGLTAAYSTYCWGGCSGRGVCHLGFCRCNQGFWGVDCSLSFGDGVGVADAQASGGPTMDDADVHRTMDAADVHSTMDDADVHRTMDAADVHRTTDDADVHRTMDAADVHRTMDAADVHSTTDDADVHSTTDDVDAHSTTNDVDVIEYSELLNAILFLCFSSHLRRPFLTFH
eukprot:gene6823-8152_t